MQDDERTPSETDARPEAGAAKSEPVAPGTAPKLSEAEAQPDKPVPNARDRS